MITKESVAGKIREFDEDLDFEDLIELRIRVCRETHFDGISQSNEIIVMDVNGNDACIPANDVMDVRDRLGLNEESTEFDPGGVLSQVDEEMLALFAEQDFRITVNEMEVSPVGVDDPVPLLEDDESF